MRALTIRRRHYFIPAHHAPGTCRTCDRERGDRDHCLPPPHWKAAVLSASQKGRNPFRPCHLTLAASQLSIQCHGKNLVRSLQEAGMVVPMTRVVGGGAGPSWYRLTPWGLDWLGVATAPPSADEVRGGLFTQGVATGVPTPLRRST